MTKRNRKQSQSPTSLTQRSQPAIIENPSTGSVAAKKTGFLSSRYFAPTITALFFIIALIGMLHHEMWRDEHQAWLVARDADSLAGVLKNMRYEGNPALWHSLLYIITLFTHDPAYMQALHLIIATGFIFVFNRYAPLKPLYKILFSFGYFPLYEYAVISRSYGLGIFILFIVCALFQNRNRHYILIGVLLFLLANVTIYQVIISLSIAGILLLDYLLYQKKTNRLTIQLITGGAIFLAGVVFSFYQIIPTADNTFPAPYPAEMFHFPRWSNVFARLFSTYFYIPDMQEINFWNTNIYTADPKTFEGLTFNAWLKENPVYLWTWVYLPLLLFFSGILIFLKKPLIMLLYTGGTIGLLSVLYYTGLLHSRYVGHLLILLVVCYWLAKYYPDKQYNNFLDGFARFGNKISRPLLVTILSVNIIGAAVAYTTDYKHKFSPSKDAADFIKANHLDTLTMTGTTDFTLSPITSYLDNKIFYLQMNDFGSFCMWNKQRRNDMNFMEQVGAIDSLLNRQKNKKLLWIKDSQPMLSLGGKTGIPFERGIIANDIQVDLLKSFEPGIVSDEKYYIYLLQKTDTAGMDFTKYPVIN